MPVEQEPVCAFEITVNEPLPSGVTIMNQVGVDIDLQISPTRECLGVLVTMEIKGTCLNNDFELIGSAVVTFRVTPLSEANIDRLKECIEATRVYLQNVLSRVFVGTTYPPIPVWRGDDNTLLERLNDLGL